MIRFTMKTSIEPLESSIAFLEDIDQQIFQIGEAVIQEIKPELLDELQDKPPKRDYPEDYPIEWTSEKQKKAFFASDGFGAGIPTERTDSMINSWEIFGEVVKGSFNIVVRNTKDWSKFIVGSLAKTVSRAARFQQNFHAITGWPLATIPVHRWTAIAQTLFEKEFNARWGDAVKGKFTGRAFTTPRKKE